MTASMVTPDTHLQIGSLIFERLDQIDLTGPFEVFSRIPNSTYRVYGKSTAPLQDYRGLRMIADATLAEAPQLDLIHIPGGFGQESVMDDEEVLNWIRLQAEGARCVFSVCTGALILGAAGLLQGRRSTTHWASIDLLSYFGATIVNQRVVKDGRFVSAAGVTSGIDGALRIAADLRGNEVAQGIQLNIEYAPEPPFASGTPESAPPAVLARARESMRQITAQREQTARRIAKRLGLAAA